MKYNNLDEGFLPKVNQPCLFIRYGEKSPLSGWMIDNKTVFIGKGSFTESVLNFQYCAPIAVN